MKNKASIRVKFVLGVALVITLVVLVFSFAVMTYNINSVERKLERQMQRIGAITQDSLSIALWQYNHDYVASYIDSLFLYDDVVYAGIFVKEQPVRQQSLPNLTGITFAELKKSRDYLTSEVVIFHKDVHVGDFQLAVSRKRIFALMITASKLSITALILVNFGVFLMLYLLSTRYIFRPLSRLESSVKAISSGNLDEPIDTSGEDEISQLAISFQQMMYNLKSMTASRDELNKEIHWRKQSEKRIGLLNSLKERLLKPQKLTGKLQLITQSVIETVGADFCRIWILREGDICDKCRHREICYGTQSFSSTVNCFHLSASAGRYTNIEGRRCRVPMGASKIGKIASGLLPGYVSNNLQDDPLLEDQQWVKKLNLESFGGYKLFAGNEDPLGVMVLFSQKELSDKENEVLLNIASTASEVISSQNVQEQLIKSERKFRTIYENSQVGMYRSRISDGKIMDANQRMAEIFEYDSAQECIDKYVAVEHYVDPLMRNCMVDKLLEEGRILNHEIQITTNRGAVKWIQFSGTLSEVEGEFEGVATDITDKKAAEEKVKRSLAEKDVLIKEIHHRVKNNMQTIQSLFSLQANDLEDDDAKRLLLDCNSRIKSMALIHEVLYQADDISRLDLNRYFNSIVGNLSRIYQEPYSKISVQTTIDQIYMDMDICIGCGLVLNELVTNAYKYGFANRESGVLSILLKQQVDSTIVLKVADDGPGFPEGFTLEETESLGLKIVRILVAGQLKGELTMLPPPGASIEIRFPFFAQT